MNPQGLDVTWLCLAMVSIQLRCTDSNRSSRDLVSYFSILSNLEYFSLAATTPASEERVRNWNLKCHGSPASDTAQPPSVRKATVELHDIFCCDD